MSTETYQPWEVPTQDRRTNPYMESLRMDLSRIEQQFARATHENHVKMLQAAARDVRERIATADSKRFETNGKK